MKPHKINNGIPEMDFEIKVAWWPDKWIKKFFSKEKKMNKTLIEIALAEYGTKEISGSRHNMDIVNYAKNAGFAWVNDDETPWCSIFLSWAAMKANLSRSKKANARSWLSVGEETKTPETGDVAIMWRGNPNGWHGHVGIFINREKGIVRILGGNQSNEVNISEYPEEQILGYRRLTKA